MFQTSHTVATEHLEIILIYFKQSVQKTNFKNDQCKELLTVFGVKDLNISNYV